MKDGKETTQREYRNTKMKEKRQIDKQQNMKDEYQQTKDLNKKQSG